MNGRLLKRNFISQSMLFALRSAGEPSLNILKVLTAAFAIKMSHFRDDDVFQINLADHLWIVKCKYANIVMDSPTNRLLFSDEHKSKQAACMTY